ncbi:MAG: PAS domain S-box protein [Bacteroidia bacterium]|nr:PAS domain S-box protein [Bacteroidia bacterium]
MSIIDDIFSKSKYQLIAETSSDAIISIDTNHTILSWNKAAVKMFGYTADEIIGKKVMTIIPDKYKDLHIRGVENYIQTEKPKIMGSPVEVSGLKKNGTEFPIELTLSSWKDGKKLYFAGIIRDITKRKSSDARMKAILESSNDAIIYIDSNHIIRSWNKASERMFGYSSEEATGQKVMLIIPDRFKELHLKGVENFLSTKTLRTMGKPVEVAAIGKNGIEFPIELTLSAWQDGEEYYFTGILRDITERKIAEKLILEKNTQLEVEKKLVLQKQQEITDSINYAKRIQYALLPRIEEITACIPNSFVLYMPKDIVAGDFYWFHKTPKKILIAAADSTGHGVPGALTSMICSGKLDAASEITDNPGEILSITNKGIKRLFKHHEEADNFTKVKDGMDIALCSIDLENYLLEYSGANRPFWLIREGEPEIIKIIPTKASIGGDSSDEQVYENHTIPIFSKDIIYLFTDGYSDQDGGEKNRKLSSKTLSEILFNNQAMTMEEQKKLLYETIRDWKGDKEQRDDILIIGIKIP